MALTGVRLLIDRLQLMSRISRRAVPGALRIGHTDTKAIIEPVNLKLFLMTSPGTWFIVSATARTGCVACHQTPGVSFVRYLPPFQVLVQKYLEVSTVKGK
jgi:hypothetical protein